MKAINGRGVTASFSFVRRVAPSPAGVDATQVNLLDRHRRTADEITISVAFAAAIKQDRTRN